MKQSWTWRFWGPRKNTDEIQKLDGWQEQIKAIYDSYKKIKFGVSGFASLFIRQGGTLFYSFFGAAIGCSDAVFSV